MIFLGIYTPLLIGQSHCQLPLVHPLPSIHSMPTRLNVLLEEPSKNLKELKKHEPMGRLVLAEMLNSTSLMAWAIITFLVIPSDFRAKRITVI